MEEMTFSAAVEAQDAIQTPLQAYFLRRLERVLRLRFEQGGNLNEGGTHLLDHAIYSTYCDCLDLDVGGAAKELIRQFPLHSVEHRN